MRVVPWTSTIGDAPVTVIVSATPPTFMSASILITPVPDTITPSRLTTENPVSVKVTLYLIRPAAGSRCGTCPVASVIAVLAFSISTGLAASTVTPGSTSRTRL